MRTLENQEKNMAQKQNPENQKKHAALMRTLKNKQKNFGLTAYCQKLTKTLGQLRALEYQKKHAEQMRNKQNKDHDKSNKEFEYPDGRDHATGVPLIKPNIIKLFKNAQKCL